MGVEVIRVEVPTSNIYALRYSPVSHWKIWLGIHNVLLRMYI